jgi:predicted RNA-binding Zn ribbon-like protein
MSENPDFPMHHGRISLSFAGTLGDRGSTPVERLTGPAALGAWLELAGLESRDVPVSPAALRRAIRLRESIARIVADVRAGRSPSAEDVASLNSAARNGAHVALDARTLRAVNASRDRVGAALGAIARDAIELLAREDERERLRSCALASCGSIFLTPAGRRERRWCSMARCGNRAKVNAFRKRTGASKTKAPLSETAEPRSRSAR